MNLIWFSEVKWDYLRTRKQHLLSRFPKTDNILFIQPFAKSGDNSFFPKHDGNVIFVTIPTFRQSQSRFFNQIFEQNWLRLLFFGMVKIWVKLVVRFTIKNVDSWLISNVYFLQVLEKLQGEKTWDFNDNPEQFGKKPVWAMQKFHQFCKNENHKIIASSEAFSEKIKLDFQRDSVVIPNGVEHSFFAENRNAKQIKKSKIIGYVGVISEWFFDFELVEKIAKKFTNFEIHLIGPQSRGISEKIEKLQKIDNVKVLPAANYEQLPSILQTLRVGIIPLKNNEKVKNTASGKFLQYVSAGLPTVSVKFLQFEPFSECVYFAESHSDFLRNLENAISDDVQFCDDLLEKYDWDSIAQQFRNEVKNEK